MMSDLRSDQRLHNESRWHDDRFSMEAKMGSKEGLLVGPDGYQDVNLIHIFDYIGLGDLSNQSCLELGCGSGYATALMAKKIAVVASDISIQALGLALRRAEINKVQMNVRPVALAGEELPFCNGAFDIVYGVGVLHHLDLRKAGREIYRVLRPGGKLAFVEPLGHNLVLNVVRKLFSGHSPNEVVLRYPDIVQFCRMFSRWEYYGYMFLSILRLVVRWRKLVRALEWLDSRLLMQWPFLQRYCRCVAVLATR